MKEQDCHSQSFRGLSSAPKRRTLDHCLRNFRSHQSLLPQAPWNQSQEACSGTSFVVVRLHARLRCSYVESYRWVVEDLLMRMLSRSQVDLVAGYCAEGSGDYCCIRPHWHSRACLLGDERCVGEQRHPPNPQ